MGKQKKQQKAIISQEMGLKNISGKAIRAIIFGVVFFVLFVAANEVQNNVNTQAMDALNYFNQFSTASKAMVSNVQSYAVSGTDTYADAYLKEVNETKSRENALNGLQDVGLNADEKAALEKIGQMSDSLLAMEAEAIALAEAGDSAGAMAVVFGEEYETATADLNSKMSAFLDGYQDRIGKLCTGINIVIMVYEFLLINVFLYVMYRIIQLNKFAKKELMQPILKVSEQMITLAEGDFHTELDLQIDESEVGKMAGAIDFMKKNLIEMIEEISNALEQMGQGNYQLQLEKEYVGEFVEIKESFIKIKDDMSTLLGTVREASAQVDSGAKQLANAAQDLAEGSTEQAHRVSDLTSLTNTVCESMEENAKGAEDAVIQASHASNTLQAGNRKMQELKGAIAEINTCSEQIKSIIKAIQDIASQTNLLALNAAIEAARAGEAGRGFAVVAEQVKNLAAESAKAAGETTELIETTILAVEKGIQLADETAASMDNVMVGAKQSTEMMADMAQMLKTNVQHIHEIDENLSSVSEVVDNNSATSQETAAVSEELQAQVETMVQMLEHLKI